MTLPILIGVLVLVSVPVSAELTGDSTSRSVATTATAALPGAPVSLGATSCVSDPSGPVILGHNQDYTYHWVRESVYLPLQIECNGGQGALDLWWEVDGEPVGAGDSFVFEGWSYGRGVHEVIAYCMDVARHCASQPFRVEVFDDDAFTIVLLPDTQYYTAEPWGADRQMFYDQTLWITAMRDALNTVWVAHLGDVIEGCCPPDSIEVALAQWDIGHTAMSTLEEADPPVPFSVAIGNHDYGPPPSEGTPIRDSALFESSFPPEGFQSLVALVDHYEGVGFFEDENSGITDVSSSSYHLFTVGELEYLHVAYEYCPREAVMTWASQVIAAHPSRRVFLTTHSFANCIWAPAGAGRDQQWNSLVRLHRGVYLHASGHVNTQPFVTETGDHGNDVNVMIVNHQFEDYGGNGYLRFLVHEPSRNMVTVRGYSPYRDKNPHASYPPIKEPYSQYNFDFWHVMSSDSVPVITASGAGGPPGSLAVQLSAAASYSYDEATELITYHWSFGDGYGAQEVEVEHLYDEPGPYVVELTVINSNGQVASKALTLEVPMGSGINWHGDADHDGVVDENDLALVIAGFGEASDDDVIGTGKMDEYDALSVMCNWGRLIGDVNQDCQVGVSDLLQVTGSWGECAWPCAADIGAPFSSAAMSLTYGPDGVVNDNDLDFVTQNWGATVPDCHEPPSAVYMAMVEPYLEPEWLNGDGTLDATACEALIHWFGNPAYD